MNKVFIFAIAFSILFHSVIFASFRDNFDNKIADNITIIEISVAKKGSKTNVNIAPQEIENKEKNKKIVNKVEKSEKVTKKSEIPIKKLDNKKISIEKNQNKNEEKIELDNSNKIDIAKAEQGYDIHGKDSGNVSPKAHKIPKPKYPRKSRINGEEGVVTIELIVTEIGKAKEAKVVNSSGFEALDKEALAIIPKSQFIPAKINGIAVASVMRLKIRFSLED